MRSKLESYLGFAKKSRNLISGTNTCLHGMNQGKIRLLILAEDLAENTMEKLKKAAEKISAALFDKFQDYTMMTKECWAWLAYKSCPDPGPRGKVPCQGFGG